MKSTEPQTEITAPFTAQQASVIQSIANTLRCPPGELVVAVTCACIEGFDWSPAHRRKALGALLSDLKKFIDEGTDLQDFAKGPSNELKTYQSSSGDKVTIELSDNEISAALLWLQEELEGRSNPSFTLEGRELVADARSNLPAVSEAKLSLYLKLHDAVTGWGESRSEPAPK